MDLDADLAATSVESAAIKAIDRQDVHKICSGQVILTLAVAVKELVENSLDAGAKYIDIKLKNKGLDGIEVCDDGHGVQEKDIDAMTSKHYTSKISKFDDLQTVQTFGFRGEALSSLCALSDMVIITRHEGNEEAIRVELNSSGEICKRQICTRSKGTTVILSNLFKSLPVRRRDFVRNIKREFTKLCHILQAYSLLSKGVRIRCTNLSSTGAMNVVLNTTGSEDLRTNIQSLFGKFKANEILCLKSPIYDCLGELIEPSELLEFFHSNGAENVAGAVTIDDINHLYECEFRLEGYISNCSQGSGRSSKDRQFLYINNRPCDLKSVSKAINDLYRSYNAHKYPFICLNIILNRRDVDINLTPDKRQVLVNKEHLLILLIQRSMMLTYGQIPSTYKLQNSSVHDNLIQQTLCVVDESSAKATDIIPLNTSEGFREALSQWKNAGDTNCDNIKLSSSLSSKRKLKEDEITTKTYKLQKIQNFLHINHLNDDDNTNINLQKTPDDQELTELSINNDNDYSDKGSDDETSCRITRLYTESKLYKEKSKEKLQDTESKCNSTTEDDDTETIEFDEDMSNCIYPNIVCNEMLVVLKDIERNMKAERELKEKQKCVAKINRLRFKSTIQPSQNKSAEEELEREIAKESFYRMEVLGQFNRGFIITKLDSDIFIVDQHATDEKYNFEVLQRTMQLQYQPLTVVQPLNLTVMGEMTLLDNLETFERNGFKFIVNEGASPTKKVKLVGKPFSKNWEFGTEDIDELIFMLQDAPTGTVCRPSRINAMLASRACRSSIMIGQALKPVTMQKLITHMAEMEQPWNCPHGRPTMRHLVNISMLV